LLPKNNYFIYSGNDLVISFEYTIPNIYVTSGTYFKTFPILNEEYEFRFVVSDGTPLPNGIELNQTTGEIYGTPYDVFSLKTFYIYAIVNDQKKITSQINILVSSSNIAVKNFKYLESNINRDLDNDYLFLKPSIDEGTNIKYSVSTSLPSGIILDSNSGIISGNFANKTLETTYTITATSNSSQTNTFNLKLSCDILRFRLKTGQYNITTSNIFFNGRKEEIYNYSLGFVSKGSYSNSNYSNPRGLLSKNFFYDQNSSLIQGKIKSIITFKSIRKSNNEIFEYFFLLEVDGNLVSYNNPWTEIVFRTNKYLKAQASQIFYNSISNSTIYRFNNLISNADFIQDGATEIVIN
jgi:hypothetical protein